IIQDLKEKLNNGNAIQIKIKVIAGAKQNSVEIFDEEIIKIKINKPAVDGKANKAIIEYLSGFLDIPRSNIKIIHGEKSTLKDLRIIPKRRTM
ncbi:MAG: DUF167 domain-containing protein, partial [Candidatus Gastranaerophilales bacterium]|nr:DUF167 domain-containing protein [Candidatus Gastranaerophilales bacterium]